MVKRAIFWLVILVLIGLPVVAAEIYLRGAGLGDPILFYTSASYRYAPMPNQRQVRRGGATVTIDSKGLRNTKDWTAKADAKILFVGDSVTWGGTYIDDRDVFSDGVCQRLAESIGKGFICGNASANQYGTDNMAERIRYKDFDDEAALVVTLISHDTLRGLADVDGRFFFTRAPPAPFKALWEAATFATWDLYHVMRPVTLHRGDDDDRVVERSLENLFSAIRETQKPGRQVLIVLSPVREELNGHESALTKRVQAVLARSGFDVLDLHAAVSSAFSKDFYYDSLHLDVTGHHFYADQIAQRLAAGFGGSVGKHAPTEKP